MSNLWFWPHKISAFCLDKQKGFVPKKVTRIAQFHYNLHIQMAVFVIAIFARIEKSASILSHVFLWQGLFWASLLQVEGEWLSSSNIVRLAIIEAAIFPSISWLASCYDGREGGKSRKLRELWINFFATFDTLNYQNRL